MSHKVCDCGLFAECEVHPRHPGQQRFNGNARAESGPQTAGRGFHRRGKGRRPGRWPAFAQ
eukprot:11215122-Lingulodinium_polyedra.AAC.1